MQLINIREIQINRVKQSLTITDGEKHFCRLMNDQTSCLHGEKDTSIYIYSLIPNDTMELLVAYLQSFEPEDEGYPLIQDDIAELLTQFYDCEIIEMKEIEAIVQIHSIELNEHWDTWTGYFQEINKISFFKRKGLYEYSKNLM